MYRVLLIASLLLMFYSCSTSYYYAQVDSTSPNVEKDKYRNLIVNTDSLQITFSFSGENMPVRIRIFNKMKRLAYIDWRESYFMFGDNGNTRFSMGQYMRNWEGISALQPQTQKTKEVLEISDPGFGYINAEFFSLVPIPMANGETRMLESVDFNEQTTPLYIRSSIAIKMESIFSDPIMYDQDFYVSKLTKAINIAPQKIEATDNRHGDVFYTRKKNKKRLSDLF